METGVLKPMRGWIGHMVFEGEDLGGFLPALAGGEAVGVGGGGSFGLGRVLVSVE